MQTPHPRWRGFNLLGMFCSDTSASKSADAPGFFPEEDFRLIADLGFNYVRLPLSYRIWSSAKEPFAISEEKLAPLDDAVSYAQKYNLHLEICLHRIPGYCVNEDEPEAEPFDLWTNDQALEAAAYQWGEISKRYRQISAEALDFDLTNEPGDIPLYAYLRVARRISAEMRKYNPQRTLVLDGTHWGRFPPLENLQADLQNCRYTCRGYDPFSVTHYNAPWRAENDGEAIWPGGIQKVYGMEIPWDRKKVDDYFGMWRAVADHYGVAILCSEMGCYNQTPHDVVLAWFEDNLQSLQNHDIGFALWNFRGAFGVLDSGRSDVSYKKYAGHLLDEKLLKLLQKY